MTPFGEQIRALRQDRGISLRRMADALGVSPAYLSALERGYRSQPSRAFLHQVCQYLSIIWDEADRLNQLAEWSNPRPTLDLRGLDALRFRTGNRLAAGFAALTDSQIAELERWLDDIERQPTNQPIRQSRPRKKKLTPRQ